MFGALLVSEQISSARSIVGRRSPQKPLDQQIDLAAWNFRAARRKRETKIKNPLSERHPVARFVEP
jgi:hypothetical protein